VGKWRNRRIPREAANTDKQAERWVRSNLERLRSGEAKPKVEAPTVVRVKDLEDKFLEIRAGMGLRPATLHQDRSVMHAHIVAELGEMAVSELQDVSKLLAFVDTLKEQKKSPATIRNVLSVFRNFFDIVQTRKLAPVTINPTRDPAFIRQGVPRRQRAAKPQLTIETAEKLLTCELVPEHRRARYLLACTSGLRDGEISGLQWEDVDLDAPIPVLHVRKAYAIVRGHGSALDPTKTVGSVRDVPIHSETVKALRGWKAKGWVEWVGRHPKAHDFLFPSEAGQPYRPRSARLLRLDLKAAGCEDTYAGRAIDFHALRRSFATWLARARVESAIRKALMGHIEGDVTESSYIERDLAMLQEAVLRIRLDLAKRGQLIAFPVAKTAADGGTPGT
jgi:integrase